MTAGSGAQWPGATAARRRIALIFFCQAIAAGSFLTRIPDIQRALAIDEAALGLTLLGQPLGALALIVFASTVVERIGTRRAMLAGLPFLACAVAAVALAPTPIVAFACLAAYGGAFSVTNVAMNVEADRIEALHGARVMNRCHGMASLGLLVTSAIGAGARGLEISPALHLLPAVPIVLAATLLLVVPLRPAPPRGHAPQAGRRLLVRPTMLTFCLVGVVIASFLLEGAGRNWSIIYMRDSFAVSDLAETASLPVFIGAMALGRLAGDPLATRFGPAAVARAAILTGFAGLAVIVAAPAYWPALVGFVLTGFGASVIYPLTLSAAARSGDRPASENVSAVTMVGALVVLGAPALLGYVAARWGIRASFAVTMPALLISLALSRFLEPDRARRT